MVPWRERPPSPSSNTPATSQPVATDAVLPESISIRRSRQGRSLPELPSWCPRLSRSVWLAVVLGLLMLAAPLVGVGFAADGSSANTASTGATELSPPAPTAAGTGGLTPSSQLTGVAGTSTAVAAPGPSLVDETVAPGIVVDLWELPLSLVVLGYHRHADEAPLTNDIRKRIFDQILATPGVHIAGIVDRTGIPRSTVRYHLRVLEDADVVDSETLQGKHRYGPAGADLAIAAAYRDAPARETLDAVDRFEPVTVTGLANELGLAPSTVSHHLDRLEEAGLVERDRDGARVLIRQGDAGPPATGTAADIGAVDGPSAGLSAE